MSRPLPLPLASPLPGGETSGWRTGKVAKRPVTSRRTDKRTECCYIDIARYTGSTVRPVAVLMIGLVYIYIFIHHIVVYGVFQKNGCSQMYTVETDRNSVSVAVSAPKLTSNAVFVRFRFQHPISYSVSAVTIRQPTETGRNASE